MVLILEKVIFTNNLIVIFAHVEPIFVKLKCKLFINLYYLIGFKI